jgi:hypothetical protein
MLAKGRTITLLPPRQDSGVALERCIRARRSVRAFRNQALTEPALGQLLWAAQGTTSADGMRAVASAGALYPLELYFVVGNVASLDPACITSFPTVTNSARWHPVISAKSWLEQHKVRNGSQWRRRPSALRLTSNARAQGADCAVAAMSTWKQGLPPKA